MKIFNAVLLAGLFAAAAAQTEPEVDAQWGQSICPLVKTDLDIKILKVVDSNHDDKDSVKFTAFLQLPLDVSVKDLTKRDLEVRLFQVPSSGYPLGDEIVSVGFDEEGCKVRSSGKSAVCKDEWSRITISEVRVPFACIQI
jgi:hypothetical protein